MNNPNMTLSPDVIGITVTYKDPVVFYLRMIGIKEENDLRQKLFGLSDEERAEKEYQQNVEMLAGLVESPEGIENENALFTSESVKSFFAEKTPIKERIAEYAVRAYFVKLQPEIFFL